MNNFSYIKSDRANWVHDQIANEIKKNFDYIKLKKNIFPISDFNKKIHFLDFFNFTKFRDFSFCNFYTLSYFHGYPDSIEKNLKYKFKKLISLKSHFNLLHVSHNKMKNYFLESGINENNLIKIPICLDDKDFLHTKTSKINIRRKYKLPLTAFIVGSFQKDGIGWGEGNEMKFIKGPDILCNILDILSNKIPEIMLLLTGPARGYVKRKLNDKNIKFIHLENLEYKDVIELYRALDLYLISSREEGGPRAFAEAMISKTPIVSTPVGMVGDFIEEMPFISSGFTPEELANSCLNLYNMSTDGKREYLEQNFKLSQKFTYKNNINLWNKLLYR